MSSQNPYAAPKSDVVLPSTGSAIDKIKTLPRFTTWAVLGLAIITMGIYPIYWLYSRTKRLNATLSEELKIPNWVVMGALTSYILYFVLTILSIFVPELAILGTLLVLVYFVLFIIWIYKFRGVINTLTDTKRGDTVWIGPILTFFINVYYFQYKINQIHDNS